MAVIVFMALRRIFSMCGFHVSFVSIIIPKYLHVSFGVISPHVVCSTCSVLILFLALGEVRELEFLWGEDGRVRCCPSPCFL
jgi:hypothetical protein